MKRCSFYQRKDDHHKKIIMKTLLLSSKNGHSFNPTSEVTSVLQNLLVLRSELETMMDNSEADNDKDLLQAEMLIAV